MKTITSRDPKGLHVVSLFEAIYNKAGLDETAAQRLNENGGDFQADILAAIQKYSVTNQFANEEIKTDYTYPEEYTGPKPIEEQIKAIAAIFNLDPAQALEYAKQLPELPAGAEGWFAIPRWDKVGAAYGEALEKVIAKLKESRTDTVTNYREGQLGPKHLRQTKRTEEYMAKVMETQSGDILIIAAQFGKRHRGRSVRRARECFQTGEFGLGAFANGCMILTHPEKEVRWEQLHIDCSGDEYSPGAGGGFSRAPFWYWRGGKLRFYTSDVSGAFERYGTASAFLPQPPEAN